MTITQYRVRLEKRALVVTGTLDVSHVGTKQAAWEWQQTKEALEARGYRIDDIGAPVATTLDDAVSDLLAACRVSAQLMEDADFDDGPDEVGQQALAQVRAAIAKAEGLAPTTQGDPPEGSPEDLEAHPWKERAIR